MASTTLANLLTTYLAENNTGDISATDLQTVVSKLWETSIITGAADDNVAIFYTDLHSNAGAIKDSGFSIYDLPLGTSVVPVINGKISYPVSGSSGDLLQYNGTTADWVTPTKSLVGLSNVDNTSDISKPISTLTQAALDGKQDELYLSYSELASVKTYLFGINTDLGIELETAAAVPFDFKNSIAFTNNAELELPNFLDETAAGAAASKESKIYYDTTDLTVKFSDGTSWINITSAADHDYNNTSSGLSALTTQDAIDEIDLVVDTLFTGVIGIPNGDADLGTVFTGSIIQDNTSVVGALQDLETAVESLPAIASGSWTPTITNSLNLTLGAVTLLSAKYTRVGDTVMFNGAVNVNPTSAATSTIFRMSLPIPSNFASGYDANGLIVSDAANFQPNQHGFILADTINDELYVTIYSQDGTAENFYFNGSYTII